MEHLEIVYKHNCIQLYTISKSHTHNGGDTLTSFMEHIRYIHRRSLGGCKERQMPPLNPPPPIFSFYLGIVFFVTELKMGK